MNLLLPGFKYVNGFLPVVKQRGVCCFKLLESIKSDLYFVLEQHKISSGNIELYYVRYLDPFASGLITFAFGLANYKRRNFVFADYKYKATVEFGVEREHHCIDGKILSRTKADQIRDKDIQGVIQCFKGTQTQRRYTMITRQRETNDFAEKPETVEGIYDSMSYMTARQSKLVQQKYPMAELQRETVCHDVELLDYSSPYATFLISCQGTYNVRQFAHDLSAMLRTKGSLVDLVRTNEGPMSIDDLRVIQMHETNLEYYAPRMSTFQGFYQNYLLKFEHLFDEGGFRPKM